MAVGHASQLGVVASPRAPKTTAAMLADNADVVAAVRFAAEHSHRVGVRSGGHSWAANHVMAIFDPSVWRENIDSP